MYKLDFYLASSKVGFIFLFFSPMSAYWEVYPNKILTFSATLLLPIRQNAL